MKILFIGDIVGQPGRRAAREIVPILRLNEQIDFVIANGENAAGGCGITVDTANELFNCGIDAITSGDHLWDQKEVIKLLESERRFLRPHNYPDGAPGSGSGLYELKDGRIIGVLNLQGRVFMPELENPFICAQREVPKLREKTKVIIVDMHAEATSEKIAIGRMLDGLVSAVVGTHTHVQTADEQIFPKGTAFICDAGFTGAHESVIGREIEPVIKRFLTNQPQRFEVAKENVFLQGVLIEICDETGKALSIKRVSQALPKQQTIQRKE
ncbi:MAG: TIGR00282 family metallophosphoesterase [Limisphaerales bacterium]